MSLKPIKLFTHVTGPNPWKVVLVLVELGIPYEEEYPELATLHTPAFERYNPNGRVPAIVDPNNGDFTLWESAAILEYLVAKYDPDHKLHSSEPNESFLEKQYLYFQMSGQGPPFGQWFWFKLYHPEAVESAIDRYRKEMIRVIEVLDVALQGKEYLVGGRLSHADLAFLPWFWSVELANGVAETFADTRKKNSAFNGWYQKLNDRPLVKKTRERKAEAKAAASH